MADGETRVNSRVREMDRATCGRNGRCGTGSSRGGMVWVGFNNNSAAVKDVELSYQWLLMRDPGPHPPMD